MEKKDIESLVSVLVPAVTEGVVTALRSMGVISPTTKDSDPPKQTSDSSTQVPPKDNSGTNKHVTPYRGVSKSCISSKAP